MRRHCIVVVGFMIMALTHHMVRRNMYIYIYIYGDARNQVINSHDIALICPGLTDVKLLDMNHFVMGAWRILTLQ